MGECRVRVGSGPGSRTLTTQRVNRSTGDSPDKPPSQIPRPHLDWTSDRDAFRGLPLPPVLDDSVRGAFEDPDGILLPFRVADHDERGVVEPPERSGEQVCGCEGLTPRRPGGRTRRIERDLRFETENQSGAPGEAPQPIETTTSDKTYQRPREVSCAGSRRHHSHLVAFY